MDVMSAIMNDKRQFNAQLLHNMKGSAPSSASTSSVAGNAGGTIVGSGSGSGGMRYHPAGAYFDHNDASQLSAPSLSYSRDGHGDDEDEEDDDEDDEEDDEDNEMNVGSRGGGSGRSGSGGVLGLGQAASMGFMGFHQGRLASSSSTEALAMGMGMGIMGMAPFSPPRPGTNASSGANSGKSVLDNEEAAEVLSVMSSPVRTMPGFNGNGNGNNGNCNNSFLTGERIGGGGLYGGRYRDVMSTGGSSAFGDSQSYSQQQQQHLLGDENSNGGVGGGGLLDYEDGSSGESQSGTDVNIVNKLSLDTTASAPSATSASMPAPVSAPTSSSYVSPSNSAYSSPSRPRHSKSAASGGAVLSPIQSLLDLAGICEQQAEEEQRKSQLNSPVFQRSL